MVRTFLVGEEILKPAWHLTRSRAGELLKFGLVSLLAIGIPQGLLGVLEVQLEGQMPILSQAVILPLTILLLIYIWWINLNVIRIGLMMVRNESPKLSELFSLKVNLLSFLGVQILSVMAVGLGTLLLVFPGVYVGLALSQAPLLAVDKGMGVMDAVKKSWTMTQGVKLRMLGVWLVFMGIFFVGMIPLGLGMLVTIPWAWMGAMFLYLKLLDLDEGSMGETAGTAQQTNQIPEVPVVPSGVQSTEASFLAGSPVAQASLASPLTQGPPTQPEVPPIAPPIAGSLAGIDQGQGTISETQTTMDRSQQVTEVKGEAH
jgi:hypothetical protein